MKAKRIMVLKLWSHWRNLFCVTMKQESERREGSRQVRRHEKQGRSPVRRLIDSGDLRPEEQRRLEHPLAMRGRSLPLRTSKPITRNHAAKVS